MPAPTQKQRRAAKQRDALGWARNASKVKRVKHYVGAHIYHAGTAKLGTIKEIFHDKDGMSRAVVRSFNGDLWDWNPPLALLEVI